MVNPLAHGLFGRVIAMSGTSETRMPRESARELTEKITPTPISRLHARALRYRDFLTVALMVRKGDLFPDNWIYIHDPSVKVGRVQNFRSWSPEMVPEGMSCLGLEYFCFEGDGLWTSDDKTPVELKSVTTVNSLGACQNQLDQIAPMVLLSKGPVIPGRTDRNSPIGEEASASRHRG